MPNQATQTPDAPPSAPTVKPPEGKGREPKTEGPVVRSETEQQDYDRSVFRRMSDSPPDAKAPEPAPVSPEKQTPDDPGISPAAPPKDQRPFRDSEPNAAEASTESSEGSEDSAARREAEEIAKVVFRRDGWKGDRLDRLIDGMETDQLIEQATTTRKRQADQDRLGNRARDLESQNNEGSSDSEDDLSSLSPAQQKLVERYREIGDDETAQAQLDAFLEQRRDQPAENPTPAVSDDEILGMFRTEFDLLADRFPALQDRGKKIEVLRRADRLMGANVFDGETISPAEVITKAAEITYGESGNADHARRLQERNREQREGSPYPGSQSGEVEAYDSEQDRDRAAFRALSKGDEPSKVRDALPSVRRR